MTSLLQTGLNAHLPAPPEKRFLISPFDEPENVGLALARMPGIAGFFGASSIERLPTERAITGQVTAFKALKLG